MLEYKTYVHDLKGEWLVLIHGFGGSSNTWVNQIDDFSKSYNLCLINLPWHGNSKIDTPVSVRSVNKSIKAVLDKEGIEKASFIGTSLGTLVVSQFALQFPNRVDSLIFVGSVIEVNKICKMIVKVGNWAKELLPYKMIYNAAIAVIVPKSKSSISRTCYKKGFDNMSRENIIEWITYLKVVLEGDYVVSRLKNMNKNILFISGGIDKMFINGSRKSAKKLNKNIFIMDQCSHVCNNDNPKLFNAAVCGFLK